MSRSTTHRYVITLQACGFLEQGAGHKCRLAPRALNPGMSVLGTAGLSGMFAPSLRVLYDRVGHTVSLAILDGDSIFYVARVYSHPKGQYAADNGRRIDSWVPAGATATGKVLVAGLPDLQRRKWAYTTKLRPASPNTITNKRLFRAQLNQACEQSYPVNDRELTALAVPIRIDGM
jgi:IclR family pca regulon transcriptional regulator